jgi:hypothetical protein
MRSDTADWIERAPLEALQCRDLRHSWPRGTRRPGVKKAPPSSELIVWKVITAAAAAGGPAELERTMLCAGRCGTRRVESFIGRPGGLVRHGVPRDRYGPAYRRRRPEPDTPLERLDLDVLRGSIVQRLYPALRW